MYFTKIDTVVSPIKSTSYVGYFAGTNLILYGIDNIRDLFGHKVDLQMIKSNPVCRLGMDKPQQAA